MRKLHKIMFAAIGVFFILYFANYFVNKKYAGAYYTKDYKNYFVEVLDVDSSEVQAKITKAWDQIFYGNDQSERLYYPVEPDMAYILDVHNNDIRSEGMSYGMMIAVQMDKKEEFDRIWKWTKTYMHHNEGPSKGYFAWNCKSDGSTIHDGSASDGEEWFVTTLFFASARWGDGEGIYDYKKEAQNILNAMVSKVDSSDDGSVITNIFNKKEKQVVFVPDGSADDFTNPSYHLPHFYELWGRWADTNNSFWCEAAQVSREYFKKVTHPETGLVPDYSTFDGKPIDFPMGRGHNDFRFDAWRFAMNVAADYQWFAKDKWAVTQSNKLLDFFYNEGIETYGNQYTLEGKKLDTPHSAGLVAANAVAAALASTSENKKEFVKQLWELDIPSGDYRYYDGLLYMIAMLHVSGDYKIHDPIDNVIRGCKQD